MTTLKRRHTLPFFSISRTLSLSHHTLPFFPMVARPRQLTPAYTFHLGYFPLLSLNSGQPHPNPACLPRPVVPTLLPAPTTQEAERLLRVEQAEMGIESDGFRGRKQGKVRLPMKRAAVPKAAADRAVRARVGEEMDVDVDAVGRPGRRSQPRIAPPAAAGAQAARMEARQRQAADRRKELQARQQAMLRMAPWSKAEENLFLCIIHEFGLNWALVGDVLSACNSMQGLHRRPDVCKQKFR